MAQVFGNAARIVDLRNPFRELAEHAPIVDLLERFPIEMLARALADEEDHRRRILKRGVHADRRVRRAGPARGERDAGPAGQLADGFRHVRGRGFVPADDGADAFGFVGEGIKHGEEALAGHAEHALDVIREQGVDEQARAGGGALLAVRGNRHIRRAPFVAGRTAYAG